MRICFNYKGTFWCAEMILMYITKTQIHILISQKLFSLWCNNTVICLVEVWVCMGIICHLEDWCNESYWKSHTRKTATCQSQTTNAIRVGVLATLRSISANVELGYFSGFFNDKLLSLFINNFEAEEDDIIQNKWRDLATYREISGVNIYSLDSERLGNNEIIQFKRTGGKINFSFRCELAPGLMSESLSNESQHWFR